MQMMASKNLPEKGSEWASAFRAVTESPTPNLSKVAAASSGGTQRSAAQTFAPYSLARKTEVAPLPDPRSRTRMPGRRSRSFARSSSSQSGFGPMSDSTSHLGSYVDERGYSARFSASREATRQP